MFFSFFLAKMIEANFLILQIDQKADIDGAVTLCSNIVTEASATSPHGGKSLDCFHVYIVLLVFK